MSDYPLRTELTVLSADDPKARTIGFSVFEYIGPRCGKELDAEGRPVPLLRLEDLQPGDTVLVPGLNSMNTMRVCHDVKGDVYARSPEGRGAVAKLSFAYDDRKCWVVLCWFTGSHVDGIKFVE